jgi:hypothetical protein
MLTLETEAICGFPQSLQADAEIVPQLGYDLFFPNTFQFIIHLPFTIRRCIETEILKT